MACLAAVVVAATLAACGSSSVVSNGAAGQIRTTIRTFLKGTVDGDGPTACALLTPAARRALVSAARGPLRDCPKFIAAYSKVLPARDKAKLSAASVIDIKVSGRSATAKVKGGSVPARLTKCGGRWLISGGLGD